MFSIILSICIGIILDEIVRFGIRRYRATHCIDHTRAEVEEILCDICREAVREYAVENALLRARLAIHGLPHGYPDPATILTPNS